MKEKEVVRLDLDIWQGPIWISDFDTGEPLTGIDVIDNDPIIRELNYKCSHLYTSFYSFEDPVLPCVFDAEESERNKDVMLNLLTRLNKRLEEINDGSFVVEDRLTKYYQKL